MRFVDLLAGEVTLHVDDAVLVHRKASLPEWSPAFKRGYLLDFAAGPDHNSDIVTRRTSEEMLQVNTRCSLTLIDTSIALQQPTVIPEPSSIIV